MKHSKVLLGIGAAILGFAVNAAAQDGRSQISIQGTGFFTKNSESQGIQQDARKSAGALVGYSYQFNRLFAAEGTYGITLNTQRFTKGSAQTAIQSDVHEITGALLFRVPTGRPRFRPYALGGAGFLVFNPTDLAGVDKQQARGTVVYGGGVDLDLTHHFGVKGEYRGLIYKTPDFSMAGLDLDKFTHVAQPSAGLFFRF